ncbi:MAG TPA: hypothetical protein PK777_15920, partial [Thermoguttaceae bacterium]|nr:hypothetical protein [Thermoguttaceae bacterium]
EQHWRIIYELAGIVGVDPGPLTLRELCWMVDGRQRDQWNHTSQILAMVYNAFCSPKSRPLGPLDFHPLLKKKKPAPTITLKQLNEMGVLTPSKG